MNALSKRTPAGVIATTAVPAQLLYGANGAPVSVITPEGAYPFPSGQPLAPRLDDRPPRAFVPSPYQNMILQPRAQPGVQLDDFKQLRALANYDLLRIVIEALKGHCKGLTYEVVARQGFEESSDTDAQIETARRWMEVPDPLGHEEWDDWVGKVLEETLVTDALSVIPRHTKGGRFIGLEVIDGGSIKPLVDDRGRPPLPPSPAYQQIAFGMAETNQLAAAVRTIAPEAPASGLSFFSAKVGSGVDNELWYWPRNRRSYTLYGQSEVERVRMTVLQAINNSMYELAYFTHGNLPDSLYVLPEGWQKDQIMELQRDFDAQLSGADGLRSGAMHFVPDGKYVATKTQAWQYEYVEFLARVIAWAFSVSALPIMKQVGRNPSEVLQSSAIASGVKPLVKFVCRLVNRALREKLGLENVMVRPQPEEDSAQVTALSTRTISEAKAGLITWNQAMKEIGQDPVEEEWADRNMLVGADGVTVAFLDEIEQKMQDDAATAKAQAVANAARLTNGPGAAAIAPSGQPTASDAAPPAPASDAATKGMLALHVQGQQIRGELKQARRYAINRMEKAAKRGETIADPLAGFTFHVTPEFVQKRIREGLAA